MILVKILIKFKCQNNCFSNELDIVHQFIISPSVYLSLMEQLAQGLIPASTGMDICQLNIYAYR